MLSMKQCLCAGQTYMSTHYLRFINQQCGSWRRPGVLQVVVGSHHILFLAEEKNPLIERLDQT